MIMNPKRNSIAALGFSTWFALLSPVIGCLSYACWLYRAKRDSFTGGECRIKLAV